MQDDQRESSPPPSRTTSRRPLTRYDERGRGESVSSPQHPRSSQSWTQQPTTSYSSYSSQEYDPQFQIPSRDLQDTSPTASYPQGYVAQPPTRYPPQSQFTPPFPPTHYQESGSTRAHPQAVETSYLSGPFSKAPDPAPPLAGPPLPWTGYQQQQLYPEQRTSPRELRQHFTRESPPRGGRATTPRRGSRGRLISPPGLQSPRQASPRERISTDPYPTRRPSQSRIIDLNVPSYPPAPSSPRAPSRPSTAFQPHYPYSEVRYPYPEPNIQPYPAEGVSSSRIPHSGPYSSLSHPPSLSQPQRHAPTVQGGPLSPYMHSQTFSQPQLRGAQPLPGPGELSDIRSSYSMDPPQPPPYNHLSLLHILIIHLVTVDHAPTHHRLSLPPTISENETVIRPLFLHKPNAASLPSRTPAMQSCWQMKSANTNVGNSLFRICISSSNTSTQIISPKTASMIPKTLAVEAVGEYPPPIPVPQAEL